MATRTCVLHNRLSQLGGHQLGEQLLDLVGLDVNLA
jgi:hypothetical protein